MMDPFNKKVVVSAELRRAVDWKLFELTASLIGDDVDERHFEESKLWFQERNADDVVEERYTAGLCAYPLCSEALPTVRRLKKRQSPSKMKTSAAGDDLKPDESQYEEKLLLTDDSKYRIDYGGKKIFQVERSKFYCKGACLEAGELWIAQLDGISPYARPISKSLDTQRLKQLEKENPRNIDDILDMIAAPATTDTATITSKATGNSTVGGSSGVKGTVDRTVSASNGGDITSVRIQPPPPIFNHPHMTAEGQVSVNFVAGEAVLMPPPETLRPFTVQETQAQGLPATIAATSTVSEGSGQSNSGDNVALSDHPSKLRRRGRPTANSSAASDPNIAKDSVGIAIPTTESASVPAPSMDVLLEQMQMLQMKYGLRSTTGASVVKSIPPLSSKSTETGDSAATVYESRIASVTEDKTSSNSTATVIDSTVKGASETISSAKGPSVVAEAGTNGGKVAAQVGVRGGAKEVSWNLPANTKAVAPVTATSPAAAVANLNDQKKKKTMLLGLKVMERPDAVPLSSAALLTKKEPDAPGKKNILPAAAAARAIEGHVPKNG